MQADALLARETCTVETQEGPRVRTCEACWTAEMARALESIGLTAGVPEMGLFQPLLEVVVTATGAGRAVPKMCGPPYFDLAFYF